MDCLFCKIANEEIKAKIVYKDDEIVAFDDVNPQAPQHKLIIPRKHVATLNDLTGDDYSIIGKMTEKAILIAKQLGIEKEGYRLVINCNPGAGQTVFHIHIHLLGGRSMTWPPG